MNDKLLKAIRGQDYRLLDAKALEAALQRIRGRLA